MIDVLEYILFRSLAIVVERLPFRFAGWIGSTLGVLGMDVLRFRRQLTLDNLSAAFPDKTREELLRIARGAYRSYGTAIMEMLWSYGATEQQLVSVFRFRNMGVLDQAKARGKGVLFLSAHFGCWELSMSGGRLRLGEPIVVVAQRQRNVLIDRLITSRRERFGNKVVFMGPNVREILRALSERRIVGILGDQSGPKESAFVPFFGRPAATHRGPAAFCLKTGAPLILALIERQPDGTYEAVLEEVDTSGLVGTTAEQVDELTRRHTAMLERRIREHPEQWLWMHKRWKHTGYYETLRRESSGVPSVEAPR
jgi:KDO2-lipid IV(A) lauroyltransferase